MTVHRLPRETCEWVREVAPDLALGLLTGVERGDALAHLERCEGCRAEVTALSGTADEILLAGPEAPEWLVEMGSFTWWGIDTETFNQVVSTRYRRVAEVCGHRVYLRSDVVRDVGTETSWCPALYGRTTPGS